MLVIGVEPILPKRNKFLKLTRLPIPSNKLKIIINQKKALTTYFSKKQTLNILVIILVINSITRVFTTINYLVSYINIISLGCSESRTHNHQITSLLRYHLAIHPQKKHTKSLNKLFLVL